MSLNRREFLTLSGATLVGLPFTSTLLSGCGSIGGGGCENSMEFMNNTSFMPGSPWGMVVQLSGNDRPAFQRVGELGVQWARISASWNQIEAVDGRFDWSAVDFHLNELRRVGVDIFFATLAYAPPWACASGSGQTCVPREDAWVRFVSAFARNYRGKIQYLGMWNEPNLSGFWGGSLDQYRDLILIPGAVAARAANPNVIVVGGEFSGLRLETGDITSVLQNGGIDALDVLTVHDYHGADGAACKTGMAAQALREVGGPTLGGKMIWLTEFDSRDIGSVAPWAAAHNVPIAPFQIWNPGNPSEEYNMLNQDYSPKPSWTNYFNIIHGG